MGMIATIEWLMEGRNSLKATMCWHEFKDSWDNVGFLIFTGFEFRDKGRTVRQRWNTHFNVSNPSYGLVQIKIPAFVPEESFEAPDQKVSVLCQISVGPCDTEKGYAIGSSSTELIFAYNSTTVPAQTISLKMPTPKGSLIVTGMSLVYKVSKDRYTGENTNKAFMPAGVVSAIYV